MIYRDRRIVQTAFCAIGTKTPGAVRSMENTRCAFTETGAEQENADSVCAIHPELVALCLIKNDSERRFYEIEATGQDWSLRELKRQFNSGLFERLALSRDKHGIRKLAAQGQVVARPEDLLKEPYVLEFLGLAEKAQYSESELEKAIIDKLEQFLLEPGYGFLFEARQDRNLRKFPAPCMRRYFRNGFETGRQSC